MTTSSHERAAPGRDEVEAFLVRRHGAVSDIEPLSGGFWSRAFGYRAGHAELVVRFGDVREGFEMDRAAMVFTSPDLPIPEVLEIGDAFDGAYAISVRHRGRFLETVRPDESEQAGPALDRLLTALRAVPAEPNAPSSWFGSDEDAGESSGWREWLLAGLVDDPRHRVSGWRATLAEDTELDELFRSCAKRITDLLPACPERRDLVHGDLLHGNVLLEEDASRVTGVFSWKCSVRGDFLFDVAWCTFWSSWHPGIAALDVWKRTLRSAALDDAALENVDLRHHCYELQIGASHMGWHAWTGDKAGLDAVTRRAREILERGPLRS